MGYESRLEQELQQFHSKTNLGMEQLRLQTREMFERENRSPLKTEASSYINDIMQKLTRRS